MYLNLSLLSSIFCIIYLRCCKSYKSKLSFVNFNSFDISSRDMLIFSYYLLDLKHKNSSFLMPFKDIKNSFLLISFILNYVQRSFTNSKHDYCLLFKSNKSSIVIWHLTWLLISSKTSFKSWRFSECFICSLRSRLTIEKIYGVFSLWVSFERKLIVWSTLISFILLFILCYYEKMVYHLRVVVK